MRSAQMSMEKMIKWIISLVVLITVVWFVSTAYTKANSSINGLEWNDLSLTEQGKVTNNFNNLGSLLNGCSKFNCLCGTEKAFPFTFRDEETIIINNTAPGKAELVLMHKNVEVPPRISLNKNIFLNAVPLNAYPIAYAVSFDSGKYSVDGKAGNLEKAAFAKFGTDLMIFNNQVDRKSLMYTRYLNLTNSC